MKILIGILVFIAAKALLEKFSYYMPTVSSFYTHIQNFATKKLLQKVANEPNFKKTFSFRHQDVMNFTTMESMN